MIAATPNQGVCWTTSSTTNNQDGNNIVQYFGLCQNYPNPFNPSTRIQYQVSSNTNVSLVVNDILGNEIKTLVNDEKSPGTYEVTWNAIGLPSGVYFYQFRAGLFIETKKMLLLR